MRKLTIEDRTMLQYFWEAKGDIERYCDFEELKPEIKKELPKLWKAWKKYNKSLKGLNEVISEI